MKKTNSRTIGGGSGSGGLQRQRATVAVVAKEIRERTGVHCSWPHVARLKR